MLAEQRKQHILERLRETGQVTVTELCASLGVSDETVRRDLCALADDGLLRKVHGGAVRVPELLKEAPYEERKRRNLPEKKAIARRAAELLLDGERIAIDSGSATEAFAEEIHGVQNLTVLTDSLPVAWILLEKLRRGDFTGKLILPGGEVDPAGGGMRGSMTAEWLSKFAVDRVFLGATAISERGILFGDVEEAALTRAMAGCGTETVVLAESGKLGKESFALCLPLKSVGVLITDCSEPIPEHLCRAFAEAEVALYREETPADGPEQKNA